MTFTASLLSKWFEVHRENPNMSDKLKEFVRQTIDEMLATLPPEELRKRLSVEERLKGLSAEELARALPPETLEELARKKANGSSAKPQ